MKTGKYLFGALRNRLRFGFDGLVLITKTLLSRRKILRFSFRNLKLPFYLRNNSTDFSAFAQVFYKDEYGFPFQKKPGVIVDCGANVGLATIYFKNRFPEAKIIAIEPDDDNFEMLLKNTAGYSDIVCVKAGIWGSATNLKIVDLNYGAWAYRLQPAEHTTESTVRSITIKEIIDTYNLEAIDLLKLDIEGAEKEIFETGQDEWLPYVNTLIVETHDRFRKGTAKAVFNALHKYNFDFEVKGENLLFDMVR